MNILFLTLSDIRSCQEHGIYQDLLLELSDQGHNVYAVSPSERRKNEQTRMLEGKYRILKVRIGNTTKTNVVEKGISTLLLESQFKSAIKKYLSDVKFDLVLYSTPPITLAGAIRYVKQRDGARTYLMLKDIFPQNAVDIGMMTKSGIKGLLYRFFRWKEKQLYALSDRIGCMSPANVAYVLEHNRELSADRVEVFPNCIIPQDVSVTPAERDALRDKYGIPRDKKVFVYGGNLGKPQGIPQIIRCLKALEEESAFVLIVGSGTEYPKLEAFFLSEKPRNMKLMQNLPREDYERMIAACDVGLIFLDDRFTIPNFPSRLLSYMQAGLPVIACTDPNTDIGSVITGGGFGWWCRSSDPEGFAGLVRQACSADLTAMGEKERKYLLEYYTVEKNTALLTRPR